MYKSLTIADNLTMASTINTQFSAAGWTNESVNTNAIIRVGSRAALNQNCIVLVVDSGFRKRFGCIITEMSSVVRNLSSYAPLYLVFESEYDQCYGSWLPSAKKIFKTDLYEQQLHHAIGEIICSETK